jgi:tetratricopeptide (TPR) repeat protein
MRPPHVYFLPMVAVYPLLAFLLLASPAATAQKTGGFERIAQQADVAREADRVQEAIDLYTKGVGLRPRWREGWWALGSLFYDQDRFAEAESAFRHFVAVTPKAGPAYAFLGLCRYETGNDEQALRDFRRWADKGWSGTPELIDVSVFHFALLLTQQGHFVEALYLLATEVQRRGRSPALAEAMGLASLRMKYLPENYPPEQREMVWLAGNAALYASLPPGDFDRADEYARRLLSHYDQRPNVHYFVGTLRGFESKRAESAQEFRRELEISPQHVPALLALARLDLDGNQLDEALSFAKRAVELEPKNPDAHHVLGRVLLNTGHVQESAQELEIAKRLAPDSATIRSHLAMAYYRLGRKAEAKAEMNAFTLLKKKEGIFAPPAEKIKPEKPGPPK